MKLYDESIEGFYKVLDGRQKTKLCVSSESTLWPDVGENNMILRSEMAYELGGRNLPALEGMAITGEKDLVLEDEIFLYGPDLPEIQKDHPFARLAILRVKEEELGEGNALYNAIRKMEYVRYHLNPKGYMMRISVAKEREETRIGKEALEEGLDFAKVGQLFLHAYHENPMVEAVKLIFITDERFPYDELRMQIKRTEEITKAIDHITKNITADCSVCNLKKICDEVEGMKELHFGASKM